MLPDSPFGLETNSFDAHARQSYVGAFFKGQELGGFQSSGQFLTFVQNDNLTEDDYGLLVYYAFGELKNDRWRFAAGLQQDVFNPVSPTIVYLTELYASGNTGSYRTQFRIERLFQESHRSGVTLQVALSEPLSTLVTSGFGRITEDNGWPNIESRTEVDTGHAAKSVVRCGVLLSGFGELFCYLTDAFHVHVGYGIDDPKDSDLAATQILRNQTYFCNFVWDLNRSVQPGLQVDYRKTDFTQFQPNALLDSDAVIIASRFLWRF